MGTPQEHLPPAMPEDRVRALLSSVALPAPMSVEPLPAAANFHSIYLVHFAGSHQAALAPARTRNADGSVTLVLRVAGRHIPRTKTANEVAVMRWLRRNAAGAVPVPAVVRFDASDDNPLGHEFVLVERVPGRSVDTMYAGLDDEAKARLVEQLTDVVVELAAHRWTHVGGLHIDDATGEPVPGPLLEDTFWTAPDIARLWGPAESVRTLNPGGPYASHAALVDGYLACLAHAIDAHASLAWLRDANPRLRALQASLSSPPLSSALASTPLMLAHKDLHFANVMATPDGQLTAVLDWEFASVVPANRWDPVRAFLWNGRVNDDAATREQERLWRIFERALDTRGVPRWWEEAGQAVEDVWTVVSYTRGLVEVCPRGQKQDMVAGWRTTMEAALERLGV
ncbi:hypothetical protein CDD83_9597 [Cordyceps sp. RAO-2017]|nr:hypothetical protein CDD83_9597 [Cordyceps sp. RAO-2017]